MFKTCKKPPLSCIQTTGSFSSQYAGLPLKSCVVNLPIQQSGSGVPSPINIRDFTPYTALDFTANSVVKTFTFGQDIYCAYLDVLKGNLVGKYKFLLLDGSEDWRVLNSGKGAYIYIPDGTYDGVYGHADCSQYEWGNWTDTTAGENNKFTLYKAAQWTNGYLIFNFNGGTLESFKAQLASSAVQVVYELAEPIIIPLGGMAISTLLGSNSLLSSVGNISAEFIKFGR